MARYQPLVQNLVAAADLMPEDSYGFHPTPAQRPFGEWIGHVAMANLHFCKIIMGPSDTHKWDSISAGTTKAELVNALNQSFEMCDAALKDMTDGKALAAITVAGKTVHPVEGMIGLIASGNEHYGSLVGYLRAKGITPPSSAHAASQHQK